MDDHVVDDAPPPPKRMEKKGRKESSFFMGSGSSLIYTLVMAFYAIVPTEVLRNPDLYLFFVFLFISLFYLYLQGRLALQGTSAVNATDDFRLIRDVGFSGIPGIVPIVMLIVFLIGLIPAVNYDYVPGLEQLLYTFAGIGTISVDIACNTPLGQRASRRVHEVGSDR